MLFRSVNVRRPRSRQYHVCFVFQTSSMEFFCPFDGLPLVQRHLAYSRQSTVTYSSLECLTSPYQAARKCSITLSSYILVSLFPLPELFPHCDIFCHVFHVSAFVNYRKNCRHRRGQVCLTSALNALSGHFLY